MPREDSSWPSTSKGGCPSNARRQRSSSSARRARSAPNTGAPCECVPVSREPRAAAATSRRVASKARASAAASTCAECRRTCLFRFFLSRRPPRYSGEDATTARGEVRLAFFSSRESDAPVSSRSTSSLESRGLPPPPPPSSSADLKLPALDTDEPVASDPRDPPRSRVTASSAPGAAGGGSVTDRVLSRSGRSSRSSLDRVEAGFAFAFAALFATGAPPGGSRRRGVETRTTDSADSTNASSRSARPVRSAAIRSSERRAEDGALGLEVATEDTNRGRLPPEDRPEPESSPEDTATVRETLVASPPFAPNPPRAVSAPDADEYFDAEETSAPRSVSATARSAARAARSSRWRHSATATQECLCALLTSASTRFGVSGAVQPLTPGGRRYRLMACSREACANVRADVA